MMKREPTTFDPWNGLAAWILPDEPKTEAEILAARIASHKKWARRRVWLRLLAVLRGRPNRDVDGSNARAARFAHPVGWRAAIGRGR